MWLSMIVIWLQVLLSGSWLVHFWTPADREILRRPTSWKEIHLRNLNPFSFYINLQWQWGLEWSHQYSHSYSHHSPHAVLVSWRMSQHPHHQRGVLWTFRCHRSQPRERRRQPNSLLWTNGDGFFHIWDFQGISMVYWWLNLDIPCVFLWYSTDGNGLNPAWFRWSLIFHQWTIEIHWIIWSFRSTWIPATMHSFFASNVGIGKDVRFVRGGRFAFDHRWETESLGSALGSLPAVQGTVEQGPVSFDTHRKKCSTDDSFGYGLDHLDRQVCSNCDCPGYDAASPKASSCMACNWSKWHSSPVYSTLVEQDLFMETKTWRVYGFWMILELGISDYLLLLLLDVNLENRCATSAVWVSW